MSEPICKAVEDGKLQAVQQLEAQDPSVLDWTDEDVCVRVLCPLYDATFTLSVAPFCLQGWTLAHFASWNGHVEVFEYLVRRRPEQCTAKDVSNGWWWHAACAASHTRPAPVHTLCCTSVCV